MGRPTFSARKTITVGPLFFRFTQNGFASWGIKVGRFTRNFTRDTTTLDTPGPGSLRWGGKGRK